MKPLLLLTLAIPLTATTFTFDSNANSFNNANAVTIDQGPSAIPGAEILTTNPSFGQTIIGFGIFGHFDGIATGGTFTVDVPDGVAVQFEGHWIQQFDLGSGVQTFAIPVDWIANDFSAIIYGPGAAAFEVTINTTLTDTSVPEPKPLLLMFVGLAVFGIGWAVRR